MGSPLLLRQVYSPKFNIKKIPLHISGDSWIYSCFELMTMMAERVGYPPLHFGTAMIMLSKLRLRRPHSCGFSSRLIISHWTMMAERVGFEPTHALTRLADFESAPLDLLGTFPQHN